MGNKKVRAHGLHFLLMPAQLSERVFDSHLLLDEASEFDRAKVDVPYPVVNLFEADVLAGAGDRDVHPIAVPADAAVVAHIARLEVRWIFQTRQFLRVRPWARLIN